jgi:hypothetical protein
MEFVSTKPQALKGELTIAVDDQETVPEGDDPCGAAAIILELREGGQPRFFSQLYHCIPEDLETDAEFLRTETELNDSADDPSMSTTVSILNRLLFRPSPNDGEELSMQEIGAALLDFVGEQSTTPSAIPVIVGAKKTAKTLEHDVHGGSDGLASVVRFEVQIRFVPPPP